MKLITFAVPCYNSAAYMENCINSLLKAGDDTEIIIINDGSADDTGKIADDYAKRYPDIVRVIHQENGGHGEGVNQGLRHAKGLYYKVVDSDDWLNENALNKLLNRMRELVRQEKYIDMYVTNYVYEHPEKSGHIMHYRNVFPTETTCTWDEIGSFRTTQYLMIHSIIFRTELLHESGVVLPKHTFYVDNLFIYTPLPYVKSIYYMDLDLYRYFIGRPDQSVQENTVIKRVDQQLKVTMLMIDAHDFRKIKEQSRKLYLVMCHEISILLTITSIFLYMSKKPENIDKWRDMWNHLYEKDKRLYRRMRYISLSALTALPGRSGRRLTVSIYRLVRKIYKFN